MGRFPTRKDVILNRFEIFDTDLLGQGSESSVYAMDAEHVLRIYRDTVPWEYVEAKQAFYAKIGKDALPFAVPVIHSIGAWVGHVYTVETRMRGRDFGSVLPTLGGDGRVKALTSFLDAAAALGSVHFPDQPYGELIVDSHLQQEAWQPYLRARMEQALAASRSDLEQDVPELEQVLASIYSQLPIVGDSPAKSLVHGDYFPANVFIDDQLTISGVGDFSYATIAGDARLDIAGAVWLMGATKEYRREDSDFLLQLVVERWGEEMLAVVEFYRLYYSVYFSGCKADDPTTYWWCVSNLRTVLEGVR
jgi:aminoglycoside phosphotransferase (APT) family kinase protein